MEQEITKNIIQEYRGWNYFCKRSVIRWPTEGWFLHPRVIRQRSGKKSTASRPLAAKNGKVVNQLITKSNSLSRANLKIDYPDLDEPGSWHLFAHHNYSSTLYNLGSILDKTVSAVPFIPSQPEIILKKSVEYLVAAQYRVEDIETVVQDDLIKITLKFDDLTELSVEGGDFLETALRLYHHCWLKIYNYLRPSFIDLPDVLDVNFGYQNQPTVEVNTFFNIIKDYDRYFQVEPMEIHQIPRIYSHMWDRGCSILSHELNCLQPYDDRNCLGIIELMEGPHYVILAGRSDTSKNSK